MKFISEKQSAELVTHELAFQAVREALIAAADGKATIFPAVLAHGSTPENRFSVKSGASEELVGLKVGSYWPGNLELGLPNHHSAILLMDSATGRIQWVIEAGQANAYRTAAADAVAADALAKGDASVLAIFGAGHQAFYECVAIARIRPIQDILVVARDPAKARAFVGRLGTEGLPARSTSAQDACACADIIVTATPARAPLFKADWIRPGTHVASMGSDSAGRQELPPALLDHARLFCDLPSQAVVIGEFQHVTGDGSRIVAIGDVLAGRKAGRSSDEQVTVFDSFGIALQDLYLAHHLVRAFEGIAA